MDELLEQALNYYLDQSWDMRPGFIIAGRRTGKTALLIKRAHEDKNSIIVCPSKQMAYCVYHMAKDMGYSINSPITYDELFRYSKGRRNLTYHFEEYGMQLENILRKTINSLVRDHVETVIIDESSIDRINDILSGLQVQDMYGNKLYFEIEICGKREVDEK